VYYRLSDKAQKGSGLFNPLAVLVCYQLLPLLDDLHPLHYNKLLENCSFYYESLSFRFVSLIPLHVVRNITLAARHKKLQLHFSRKT